jgi:hypothetical protein
MWKKLGGELNYSGEGNSSRVPSWEEWPIPAASFAAGGEFDFSGKQGCVEQGCPTLAIFEGWEPSYWSFFEEEQSCHAAALFL